MSINEAIAKANAAAAALQSAPTSTSTDVATTPGPGAVSTQVSGPKLSMETLSTGQMSVDQWLKVKEFGLLIGDSKTLFPKMKVSIDMNDGKGFMPKLSIKAGNPAQYFSSFDGNLCPGVGTWEQACAKARNIDPKARPYRAVDIPMTLLEPAGDVAKAGSVIGHTTSTTNWNAWETFYKDVAAAGLMGQEVEVELGFEAKTNKNNNNWGIVTFKLIGALTQETGE